MRSLICILKLALVDGASYGGVQLSGLMVQDDYFNISNDSGGTRLRWFAFLSNYPLN